MLRFDSKLVAIAVALAALAGFVDAIAFSSLGGFFAAFMSGNATRLGVALGGEAWGDATLAGAMFLAFLSGVIFATVILRMRGAGFAPTVLAAVAALLAAAALVSQYVAGPLALLVATAAMGATHVLLRRQGDSAAGSAHLTESVVRMGERIAEALIDRTGGWNWLPHFLILFGFVTGATLGVGAFVAVSLKALWFAAFAAAALAGWFVARMRPRSIRSV